MSAVTTYRCERCDHETEQDGNPPGVPEGWSEFVHGDGEALELCEVCTRRALAWLNDGPDGDEESEREETEDHENEGETVPFTGPVLVPLALPPTALYEGETKTIRVYPQRAVSLRRFVAPGTMHALGFEIEEIAVGDRSVFVGGPHSVPVEMFSESALPAQLVGEVGSGMAVAIRITRKPRPADFVGMFMCEVLPPIGQVEP